MTRRPAWRMPAWYTRPASRILFQRQLAACAQQHVRVVKPPQRYRGGFALRVRLNVEDLPARVVTIVFGRAVPEVPHVYTDRLAESPHRYADGSLCMWYPYDPVERRWTLKNGPAALLGLVVAHLLREEWWRLTGEWPGQEAPHGPHAP